MTLDHYVTSLIHAWTTSQGRPPVAGDRVVIPSAHRLLHIGGNLYACQRCHFDATNGKAAVAHVTRCEGLVA